MAILAEYGIESVGEVLDPDPVLALDDAVRAHEPSEVLLSCLSESRFGFTRKDLVEWARSKFEPEVAITHIPVRVADDSISLEKSHTLVVATQTVAAPDLVKRLKERAAGHPHRYTIICPRAEDVTEPEIVADLASTLAELYREDCDATGQPMNPDPFHAVQNAIAYYSIDEVLISTFAGETSRWLEDDLIGKVREITDKPVEHVEVGRGQALIAAEPAHLGDQLLHIGNALGRSLIRCEAGRCRPLCDDQRFAAGECLPQRLGDERHHRMQQLEQRVEHRGQHRGRVLDYRRPTAPSRARRTSRRTRPRRSGRATSQARLNS